MKDLDLAGDIARPARGEGGGEFKLDFCVKIACHRNCEAGIGIAAEEQFHSMSALNVPVRLYHTQNIVALSPFGLRSCRPAAQSLFLDRPFCGELQPA
jgi:hypothetical protein